ncbi:hypothetical protein LAZ67_21002275 [Cordylochernes scorpioides]|uniref:Uncharacterized protein n=1 Tax=Cordylochernes scorpioides TaxID=51811 RepID=A0ABY6LRU9_9ARAC|nr:hypothetical protein LAZ67_21002275 [Cordylochernes scorpioides]
MLQWPPILAKVQPHLRVQVTKRGSGTFTMLTKVGQQWKYATSGWQRSTKGNNRTGGQSDCQNGCRSTGFDVTYHPTCDRQTLHPKLPSTDD